VAQKRSNVSLPVSKSATQLTSRTFVCCAWICFSR